MWEKISLLFKNITSRSYDYHVLFATGSFFIVMITSSIVGLVGRSNRIEEEKQNLKDQSDVISQVVENEIEQHVDKLRTLSSWFIQIGNPELNFNLERSQAETVLIETISNNQEMKSLFMIWEPNLFDGKDKKYANLEFNDSTGRFIPMFKKNSDGIVIHEYVQNYNDKDDITSYYYYKNRKNIAFGSPTLYRENAKNSLLMTITVPLRFGTRLLGFLGSDFYLDDINKKLLPLCNESSFDCFIFSKEGTIIASPLRSILTGRNVDNAFRENSDFYFMKFRRGENFEIFNSDYFIISNKLEFSEYENHFNVCLISDISKLNNIGNSYFFKCLLIGLVIFIIIYAIISLFKKIYTDRLKDLTNKSKLITDVDEQIQNNKSIILPELQELDDMLDQYHETFVRIRDLNREIESHSYDETLDTLPHNNKFQKAYNKMLETLRKIASKEVSRKAKEQHDTWIQTGLAKINESMRIGTNKVDILADNILLTLINYVDALMGGLYMTLNEEDGDYLELISAVALGKKKALRIKIEKGVGMVGTCALEKRPLYLRHLPDNYIKVVSGLGKTKPVMLALLPLMYDNELIAVVEIAFLHELEDYEKEFLDVMSSAVAGAMVTAKTNEKTETLMRKFRSQADELAHNEKLMQENIQQLKDEQQKAIEREAYLKSILNAVDNTILTVEITVDGIIKSANQKYLNMIGYDMSQLLNMSIYDLQKEGKEELMRIIYNVSTTGKFIEKEIQRTSKNGETHWLLATYTPYFDYEGKITKVLFFASDITETKRNHQEDLKKIKLLEQEIKKLENNEKD